METAVGTEKRERLVFASIVHPRRSSETNALLLAESIRAFAGSLSRNPIWFFTPEHGEPLSKMFMERLQPLDATLIPFQIDREALGFPFTAEAQAAALAESKAQGEADLLAWLNLNSVVLQEPRDFLLRGDKPLGYRPVHHTLVGSRFYEPQTLSGRWSTDTAASPGTGSFP